MGVKTATAVSSIPIDPITENATSRSTRRAPSTPIIPTARPISASGISQVSSRPCATPRSGPNISV